MSAFLPNRLRLGVINWLLLGATAVVAVLLVGNRLIQQRAAESAASIVSLHSEADPIARASLSLGVAVQDFESAVTAILQSPATEDGADAARAAAQLDDAKLLLQQTRDDLQGVKLSATLNALLDSIAVDGGTLLRLDAERRRALRNYSHGIAALAARVRQAGGNGIWVGEQNVARRSLTELGIAVNAIRAAVVEVGPGSLDRSSGALSRAEKQVEATLRTHSEELTRSPGVVWLELLREDLLRARSARLSAQSHRQSIDLARSAFHQQRAQIDLRLRTELAEPARRKLAEGPVRAEQIVRESNESVAKVSISALAIVLLVFAEGALTARVDTGGPRELHELAMSFNSMANELGKAQADLQSDRLLLEERVVERTAQLRHLAMHDPLTGLPNRRQLFEELNAAIDVAIGLGMHVALLVIDLDDFKTSNDSLGHAFGDLLLKAVAAKLQQEFGHDTLIARLGGDEFTLSHPRVSSAAEVDELAARVVACFAQPIRIGEREVLISASVGSAMAPDHGADTESLLRAADAALFRAKALGRNRHHAYSPSLLEANDVKFRTEQALRRAIADDSLLLHFQPEMSLSSRKVTVTEALLRWRRPDGSIASASEFIGLAAETDLISQLNIWALETSLATLARQRRLQWPEMRVALNVSSRQFMLIDFIARIESALRHNDLPPECLEIELTEDVLQTGPATIEALKALRAMGITIALDDFGAGFSSLASIERLPLTRIKFDRSLISSIDTNDRSAAIVTSMIRLCRDLGLAVTAEGIERPAQLSFLAGLGGVDVQGFLIARPQSVDELVGQLPLLGARVHSLLTTGTLPALGPTAVADSQVTQIRTPSERGLRR
jgi:diguanylate cyclase (GGDEF)-like protein